MAREYVRRRAGRGAGALAALAWLTMTTAAAQADVRFITRTEVKALAGAAPSDPAHAVVAALMQQLLPSGEAAVFITEGAARIEMRRSGGSSPPIGTVILVRGASQTVLQPQARTYWRMPAAMPFAPLEPEVAFTRTGTYEIVAEMRAERVAFTLRWPLPATPLPRFPTTLELEGELWIAEDLDAPPAAPSGPLGALLARAPAGFVVRQTFRSAAFGYEIDYRVADIVSEPLDRALFEVPDGYREVPMPAPVPPRAPR